MVRLRFLTASLTMLALCSIPLPGSAELPGGGSFVDDDGAWFETAVEAIHAAGITNGCDADRFCPEDPVTRAEMAVFLSRALDLATAEGDSFVDDDGAWFETAVEAIHAAGITNGCDADRFCPEDPVTRAEMAVFLSRALDLATAEGDSFVDDDGAWFETAVEAIHAAGITNGCDADRFCPEDPVTRAEMAVFLSRALGLPLQAVPPRPLPIAGNPHGTAWVPPAARAVETSQPDIIIGSGSPSDCTSAAVVAAVAQGGTIVFDCGPDPVTIVMTETAKVFNDTGPEIVLDGGGLVTLSGGGERRILYMNTCDPDQVWTTTHCDNQDHPRLTVQNMTFMDGDSRSETEYDGGGAIWVRGGRFKIVNSRFFSNRCSEVGPDVGGGAVRVFSQYAGLPVFVVSSTFGGQAELSNRCSNGGALSSIGVSWTVINSVLSHNETTGFGANPQRSGTPGGGNGGAIALDGNTFELHVLDSVISDNHAIEGGGAIFFVSNNRTGTLRVESSELRRNPSDGFETAGYPGIFYLGSGPPQVLDSVIE